jgi:hypothetical protein
MKIRPRQGLSQPEHDSMLDIQRSARDDLYAALLAQEIRMWRVFEHVTQEDFDFVVERRGFSPDEQQCILRSLKRLGVIFEHGPA